MTSYSTQNNILRYTNHSCYMHIKCDRGPSPVCLDWREICDGKVDCLDNAVDEKHCHFLEMNKCGKNEYQCHNGMCVPQEFFADDIGDPDCLDGTDEQVFHQDNFFHYMCAGSTEVGCEELASRWLGHFSCGDGHWTPHSPTSFDPTECSNGRHLQYMRAVMSYDANRNQLTFQCWSAVVCAIVLHNKYGAFVNYINIDCKTILYRNLTESIKRECPPLFFFPWSPLIDDHVRLLYTSNKTNLNSIPLTPRFVCYDEVRCDFLSDFVKINSLSCYLSEKLHKSIPYSQYDNMLDELTSIFRRCSRHGLTTDSFRHCPDSSLFHCPNSSKCILTTRLDDGFEDCPDKSDERNNQSCFFQPQYRFKCGERCISSLLIRDGVQDCSIGIDENIFPHDMNKPVELFPYVCNGFVDITPTFIDGRYEDDESACPISWPCITEYTICDHVWHCANGADEVSCTFYKGWKLQCKENEHWCMSFHKMELSCLPIEKANDGRVDCRGGSDERHYCRDLYPKQSSLRYRCWNTTQCISTKRQCDCTEHCPHGDDEHGCDGICLGDGEDNICHSLWSQNEELALCELNQIHTKSTKYFSVRIQSRYLEPNISRGRRQSSDRLLASEQLVQIDEEDRYSSWLCNRGVLLQWGNTKYKCLCPPSYYGERCQLQSDRLTVKLKFSLSEAHEAFAQFQILAVLLDEKDNFVAFEQFSYVSVRDCKRKFTIYLLYPTQPKSNSTFSVRIDIYLVTATSISHRASSLFAILFQFLPVNRLSKIVKISHIFNKPINCHLSCKHGRCFEYLNVNKQYCQCEPNWTGRLCDILYKCDCSEDSYCGGTVQNRSICVCPLDKFGTRCYLRHGENQDRTCKNGGYCLRTDSRIYDDHCTCICPNEFEGSHCELMRTSIDITFASSIKVPENVLLHFITAQLNDRPIRGTVFNKIPVDKQKLLVYTSSEFHLVYLEFDTEYHLIAFQDEYKQSAALSAHISPTTRCPHVRELFNATVAAYPLIKLIKFEQVPCQEPSRLLCFRDEQQLCYCNRHRMANCLLFNFRQTYDCGRSNYCENGGKCFQDHPTCPKKSMCACPNCFYGSKCQLTAQGHGLSLDAIIGRYILPYQNLASQPKIVKVSIGLTIVMLIIGLINNLLLLVTFMQREPKNVGCGYYLFALSIFSSVTLLVFAIKFCFLLLTQTGYIQNRSFLFVSCITIEFFLKFLPVIGEWLTASVAVERMCMTYMGINFDKLKSKRTAKQVVLAVLLISTVVAISDPLNRRLIEDEENRVWCTVVYSGTLRVYTLAMNIFLFVSPFAINTFSAFAIIVANVRRRSTTDRSLRYRQHLCSQLRMHKHLIISPFVLMLLALPRLFISFMLDCMKSADDSWLFLVAYFISFVPHILNFVVFVLPSNMYKRVFDKAMKKHLKRVRGIWHMN